MAKPKVFVSSTFYNLRHLRSSLEGFIDHMGYDPIMSEKGKIAYDPDMPLDESCYREVSKSDIFVLVVGGRYGSAASDQTVEKPSDFNERYESITKKEYQSAVRQDIPIYILIEKNVYSEFETYSRNKGNSDIEYAHVDSINVFRLLEDILNQKRNNPIFKFENHIEIEEWLQEQWAGLFQDFINRRSERKQLSSLSEKVEELASLNNSLRRYLEEIISEISSSNEEAKQLIQTENEKMENEKRLIKFFNLDVVSHLIDRYFVSKDKAKEIFQMAKSIEDLTQRLYKETGTMVGGKRLVGYWREHPEVIKEINEARTLLGEEELSFKDNDKSESKNA